MHPLSLLVTGSDCWRGTVKRDIGTEKTVTPFPQSSAYRNLSLLKAVQNTTCTHAHIDTHMYNYICVQIYINTHNCTHTHMHIPVNMHVQTHTYTHIHVYADPCIYTCTRVETYTHMHMHICMPTNIYTQKHTYTHTRAFSVHVLTPFLSRVFFGLFFLVLLSPPDSYTDSSLPLPFLIGLLIKSNRWTLS